ncbi:MAG: S-layer homology domain-containing protein, partial [Clostridia bacterium]|nr:S-layer homology domain-containing protein [Clostridia bacterium]
GRFDPEGSLTRAMVTTVLWRREGSPAPAAPSGFSDVPSGEWYTDAVAWAKETGVVKGLTETSFGPDEYITREQLATMLFRFSSTAPVSVPERADLSPFSDDEKVSDWADEPLEWAVEAGLIKGTDGNRLAPDGFATREQFAAIIERYDNTFILKYNRPVLRSHYTEKEYPLVTDADFYVSPDGSDGNDGSFERPFATWNRAIEAVRGVEKTPEKGGITVAFKAGSYRGVHVEFTSEDAGTPKCPVVYCKYGDGDVVFDNGVTVPEGAFVPLDEEDKALFAEKKRDMIRKVDLYRYMDEIPEFSDFSLFSGDSLCTVARYPNKFPDGTDHLLSCARYNDDDSLLITQIQLRRKLSEYPEELIPQTVLYGFIYRGYRKDFYTASSYDADAGVLYVAGGNMRPGWAGMDGMGIEMCVMNIPAELDEEGEYWVNRDTGALYVYDPKGDYRIPGASGEKALRGDPYDAGDGRAMVPEYVMIDARDTGHVTFRGLDFRNASGAFIFAYKTSGITIDRCSFAYSTGRNHALFEYSRDGEPMDLTITDSEFDCSIGCAVYVLDVSDGPERYTNISNVTVDNCLFSRTNLEYDVEGALDLYCCTKGHVTHNEFRDCHRYALMFDFSCDVVVEYNNFDSAMTSSADGGVLRTAMGMDSNALVRYNLVTDTGNGYAQYSDLEDCGTTDLCNLFYKGGDIMIAGGGRDNSVIGNVFLNGGGVTVQSHIPEILQLGEAARNEWPVSHRVNTWNRILGYCDTVPGYREELEARRPGASSFSFDFLNPDDPNFFLAPVTVVKDNTFINKAKDYPVSSKSEEFLTEENNKVYGIDENPYFINPTIGDYRMREDADCPYIPFEKIGRY